MTTYNIEMHDGVRWQYAVQTSTLKAAVEIAKRRGYKMRVRKVVKTIVWSSKPRIGATVVCEKCAKEL